ncbi:MAG: peptidylprolyl isomerase [Gemmatimonadota bacterium]|nr:peptidylprolyl isomerase [Gemmatimonadota bacterium]
MNRWMAMAVAVLAACGTESSDDGIVARVGSYELTVDEAVDLLVDEERLAADVGVVESLAQLWIDYTLLAESVSRDTMFTELDLEPLVTRQIEQVMVFQLRDSVIQVDTFVTDDELRARYESESPEVALRARHIMLQLPVGADQAARDSVRSRLEGIRERILAGEDFSALARQVSQDPGTARTGGDLGVFGRGDMVAPFEEATLALEPGEISDVVQTPMGLHIIRLDERRVRGFEEALPQFRQQVQARMVQEAESVFVAGLVERLDPQVAEGAAEIVKDLAANPGGDLSGRAARRSLVEWSGGSITVGDVRLLVQLEAPSLRAQMADGTDEVIEEFLLNLARRDILIEQAVSAGLRPSTDSIASLVDDARGQLRAAARSLGLFDLDRAPGEDLEIAIQRVVTRALEGNLSGATQVVPLGLVSFQLREGRTSTVLEAGVGEVIVGVAQIRAARQLSPTEESLMPPDTAGR